LPGRRRQDIERALKACQDIERALKAWQDEEGKERALKACQDIERALKACQDIERALTEWDEKRSEDKDAVLVSFTLLDALVNASKASLSSGELRGKIKELTRPGPPILSA
jgi:hypothetical protein